MIEWIKRFAWGHCANCGKKTLCKRYWFEGASKTWNKLMCKSCFKEMIGDMKELRKALLEKIDE